MRASERESERGPRTARTEVPEHRGARRERESVHACYGFSAVSERESVRYVRECAMAASHRRQEYFIASRKKALLRSRVRAHFIVATAVPLTHPMRMLMCRRGGWCAVQHCDRGASTTITRLACGGGGRGGGGGRCAAAEKAAVARPSVERRWQRRAVSGPACSRAHTHITSARARSP